MIERTIYRDIERLGDLPERANLGAQNGVEITKRFLALEQRLAELETKIREFELRMMADGWGGK